MSVKVEVYSTNYCPYCRAAENLLSTKGVEYNVIDVTHAPEKRDWLVQASGQRTVPQIFIDDKAVGGFSDLQALDNAGKLDPMLKI